MSGEFLVKTPQKKEKKKIGEIVLKEAMIAKSSARSAVTYGIRKNLERASELINVYVGALERQIEWTSDFGLK